MRIVVTGSSGFLGSTLVDELLRRQIATTIVGIDILARRNCWWADYTAPQGLQESLHDLSHTNSELSVLLQGVDLVVHLAADSSVDRSIESPHACFMNNVASTSCLLGACVRADCRPLLLVSTDEVYGQVLAPDAATEARILCPSNPYAASKAASELLTVSFARTYGLARACVRLGNTYGPRQHPEKFIPRVIARATLGERVPVYGDGEQSRCWMHVSDAVDALCLAISRFRDGAVYNIGTSVAHPNIAVARKILDLLGVAHGLLAFAPDRPGHDREYAMSPQAFYDDFSWCPRVSLDDGLRDTVSWYLNYHSQMLSTLRGAR